MSEDEKNRWNIIKPIVTTDEKISDLKDFIFFCMQ